MVVKRGKVTSSKNKREKVKQSKSKGILLSIWLILYTIGIALTIISSILLLVYPQVFPGKVVIPAYSLILTLLVSLFQLSFLYGIQNWKKWGVYGFSVIAIASLVGNLISGPEIFSFSLSLIFFAVFLFLIKLKWNFFE